MQPSIVSVSNQRTFHLSQTNDDFFSFPEHHNEWDEVGNERVYDEGTLTSYMKLGVDGLYKDDEKLDHLVRFHMLYTIHALPKEETFKKIKLAQIEAYEEKSENEIANLFPSFLEEMTSSDFAWCQWQYINSLPDWKYKKDNPNTKHQLQSRFTGNKHHRQQPAAGSEGMLLYESFLQWYKEFKRHPSFLKTVRPLANKIAKEMELLPTYTSVIGPRVARRATEDDEDESDAPELDYDSDGSFSENDVDYRDKIAESRSRTALASQANANNSESEEESSDEGE